MASNIRSMRRNSERSKQQDRAVVTVSLKTLNESQAALSFLNQQPLSARHAFLVSKAVRAVTRELEGFESARRGLCERMGKLNADKSQYDIPPDQQAAFDAEFQELINTEVHLEISRLSFDHLASIKIAPAHVTALLWLLDERTP